MRLRGGGLWMWVVTAALIGAALVPCAASAATVVNGDFETGNLSGWHESHATEAGDWYVYRGTDPPKGPGRGVPAIVAPPQGRFAAITDQIDPDTLILWQDVALEPNATHRLSLLAFYRSQLPLATPFPDSLSVDEELIGVQPNEQFRIDVLRPTAPLDSLAPEDILATLFQTETGGPRTMAPTRFGVDLSAFAGQTVRIRAVVVNRFDPALSEAKEQNHENLNGVLNAGIDAVSITSAGPGIPKSKQKNGGTGDRLSLAKPRSNPRNGTVLLPVRVSAAGLVTATGAAKHTKLVIAARKRVAGATTAKLLIEPTATAKRILERKHKLRLRLTVRFDPNQGANETATVPVVLKLASPHRR